MMCKADSFFFMIYEKTAESSLNAPGRYNLGEISATMGERVAAGFKRGFGRARSWRVPPNWTMTDWYDELGALSIMTAWQAMQEYDPLRGVPLDGFVYCRIKSHALTRYRQEWRYALRIAPTDSKIIERLAGADPAPQAGMR